MMLNYVETPVSVTKNHDRSVFVDAYRTYDSMYLCMCAYLPMTYDSLSLAHKTVAIVASIIAEAGAYATLQPSQGAILEFWAMPSAAV